ncbi:MAG: glycoside hydrolase family 127 protein, partial [Isosphaeraceae bacterium]
YRKRPGSHPWIGEHVGKWLHAATLAWAYTGDPHLKAKLDRVAADLIACQEPDGYLGTYVPEQRFGLYQGADWDVWSHKYNLIGLLTYYHNTGNRPALDCCRKMADLLCATFPARKSILAAGTHVGMAATSVLEPVVLLYRFTGDARYLEFARYIVKSWDEPGGPAIGASLRAGRGVNRTANGKAYEMLSNLVGLCELARATGEKSALEPVLSAWNDIVKNRLYITGSASSGEHFWGNHVLPNYVGAHIGETCVTTTWIQLNLQLLLLTGDAKFGDELERSFYNHLAAAQHPRGDDWCYFTALEGKKPYDPGINCCHSSGPRGMALAVEAAYLKTKWNGADALAVTTYESSRAKLVLGGQDVTVEQQSRFPWEGDSEVAIHLARPARFGVLVRVAPWAAELKLELNKQPIEPLAHAGWAVVPPREWKDGDRLKLTFRLGARLVPGQFGNKDRAALAWGPFVLAYDRARNPGLPSASAIGLVGDSTELAIQPGPSLALRGPVAVPKGDRRIQAIFVPFADAGSTGGDYRVWLRAAGVSAPASVLTDGRESRSRRGNQHGSVIDGDPSTFVVTYDGSSAQEDWYAVTLPEPAQIVRVVFRHGRNFHDGGWFDTHGGKPRVQVKTQSGGEWETVGELGGYPATTTANGGSIEDGQPFECRLGRPVTVLAVRVLGTPSCGDNPNQRFSSCGELEAFSE